MLQVNPFCHFICFLSNFILYEELTFLKQNSQALDYFDDNKICLGFWTSAINESVICNKLPLVRFVDLSSVTVRGGSPLFSL